MATSTKSTIFPAELTTEMFNKVKGHSTLAKLSGAAPMPFAGTDMFVFTMDGEASIVGEAAAKPAGEAGLSKVTIKPVKFVYQHRVTDEFVKISDEKQLPYLQAFSDGFSKKIARALDIAAFHGVNPGDGSTSSIVGSNCFSKAVTNTVTYDSTKPDDNIDSAVTPIQNASGNITGIAMTPDFGAALGAMKNGSTKQALYPEFRFGANPGSFGGMTADINSTLAFKTSLIKAVVGDFAGAFKWGYAGNIPLEIIEFGNPDGQGDLKATNQIVLRSEAYIGWGILDPASFTLITKEAEFSSTPAT